MIDYQGLECVLFEWLCNCKISKFMSQKIT
nr:MAG TPA: hypothetical protein [Caudoviricetes sp.]